MTLSFPGGSGLPSFLERVLIQGRGRSSGLVSAGEAFFDILNSGFLIAAALLARLFPRHGIRGGACVYALRAKAAAAPKPAA
jgi:hypothetical protein